MEAEYIGLAGAAQQTMYLLKLQRNAKINDVKSIEVRFHFIRDLHEEKEIEVQSVAGSENASDIFTKSLGYFLFRECLHNQMAAE